METTKSRINDLSGNIREYIETRIDIVKLDVADAGASAASSMVSWLVVSIIGILLLLVLSIGGAIAIGMHIDNLANGFFIIAGFYFVVILLIYFNRNSWIRKPLLNTIIKNLYKNEEV